MNDKDFDRLDVEDKAKWIVGSVLCSKGGYVQLGIGYTDIMIEKVNSLYYVEQCLSNNDEEVYSATFRNIPELYKYLLENCSQWQLA